MKQLIIVIVFFAAIEAVFAQPYSISGQITDSTGNSLPGAGISLLVSSDSSLISGTVSDLNGYFVFNNVSQSSITIKISFLGYEDKFITREMNNSPLALGRIMLKEDAAVLGVVNVTESVLPVQVNGDTVQFNSDAFKVNKDATAEDLVTKMPGVITQDGKVQAQGEEVKKVLIDGKPFLGDDPSAALKNLPAEIIEKIQVFDKRSDQAEFTGFNDGNTTKTMNIITRPQFRNGTFGRAFAGIGPEEKWKSGFNVNFFKDKRKFTLLGNANNINEQNFATDDLLGVVGTSSGNRQQGPRGHGFQHRGGGGGRGGRPWDQNDAGNFLVDQRNGITTTHSAGLNYVNQWKKTELSVSYFFNESDNRSVSDLFRQYITSDVNGLTYSEYNSSRSENANHRANIRLEHKFDTLRSILFQPRFSFQDNSGLSILSNVNSDNAGLISNAVSNTNTSLNAISFSSPLLYRHAFTKKGRTFSINFNPGYNSNDGNSNLNSGVYYAIDTIPSDSLNQVSTLDSKTWNYYSEATYTEPVGKTSQLSLTYRRNFSFSDSEKETFNYTPSDAEYNTLDSTLSNTFESEYLSQSISTNYRYNNDFWNLMAGIAYQEANLMNENQFPYNNDLNKEFYSVLPVAMIQYKFTPKKNIRMFLRSSNNPPTVNQLQDVINNNNPLQLSTGNPDLKQDRQNNLNIRYSSANTEKNTSFFMFISGTYTTDYIANSTFFAATDTTILNDVFLPAGSQLTRPVNQGENFNLRTFGNFSFPLKFIKSTLNLNGNASYSKTPGILNDEISYSTTTSSGLGFALSSNISDKFDFLVSSNAGFSNIDNDSESESDNNSFNLNSRIKTQVNPWKGLILQTEIIHQYNSGLTEDYNQDYYLWNAAIAYKFLKDQVAELRLSVFDILEQNNNITRNTTDIYYEDVRSNVIERYFMLTFTYNLKFFKGS